MLYLAPLFFCMIGIWVENSLLVA